MMNIAAKREAVRSFIAQLDNEFYTVVFEKKTQPGVVRVMTCRQNVARYSKGGTNPCAGKDDLIPTFSVFDKAYRTIWIDGILEIRGGKMTICFENLK